MNESSDLTSLTTIFTIFTQKLLKTFFFNNIVIASIKRKSVDIKNQTKTEFFLLIMDIIKNKKTVDNF